MNQSEIPVLDAVEPGPLAHAAASSPALGPYDELRGLPSQGGQWPAVLEQLRGSPMAPSWHEFFQYLGPYGWEELDRRAARLARQLRDNGVTYNVYADEANLQRPWPLDLFPLLITASDWQTIEAGVLQRVQVLETVMRDIYGERRLLKDGLLPAALVQGHPDYLRAMHGVPVVGGTHLHVVAFDLARGPQGHWWVVSQRTQAPSGLGYLLENRSAVSTQFADAFEGMNVRRLAATYRTFIKGLKAACPGGGDTHIALLTPGPYNETYFEHSYLARYLGLTLVEGGDLTVRGRRLYLKTLHGLRPVHGLVKRVDDAFLDPLETRPESRLGVPGLLEAVRAGNLLVANAPGAGFLESSALLGFLPALARRLLGEELKLPALHTWWCGEPAAMREVLPELARCVIKPTYPWSTSRGTFNAGVGPLMDPEVLASWAGAIQRVPEEHTVQAYMSPAQMPTWGSRGGRTGIVPRAAMLRVFALSDGAGSWQVLPGGMTRLVNESAGLATMALGGSSADTWVLGEQAPPDEPEFDHSTLAAFTAADVELVQRERLVTSRAAENLFWLGRYTERAENATRLARIVLQSLHGEEEPSIGHLMWIGQLAESAGLVPADCPSPLDDRVEFEHQLIGALGDTDGTPSVGYTLRSLRQAASALRERLSPEHWGFIKDAEEKFLQEARRLREEGGHGADALQLLATVSRALSAITGAQHDRMWRDDGWRLMTAGRQIERLTYLSDALSRGFYTNAVHDAAGYGVVLDLFDSTISFHARYQRSRAIAALIEHVVLNFQNPRSLGWVVQQLIGRLSRLHEREPGPLEDLSRRLQPPAASDLTRLCQSDHIGDFIPLQELLAHFMQVGSQLSTDISLRHFTHTGEIRRSTGV
ncbi:circularly permuted type 2 ATP-grasp protein [Ottowia testudinis]|uniref:Circularly permuted type 2 ATP-grasp protein n=1 Tax=Ottowia testudinis TaxID=2816950 RepID=A0A975CDN5_9BURK|nr:circularly permuted type 2 ATP-grasp protein [Ottowia testudinis]QTD43947.1 circularly permuted type 2 ATP-grasp protein [Ottowia testudinis]